MRNSDVKYVLGALLLQVIATLWAGAAYATSTDSNETGAIVITPGVSAVPVLEQLELGALGPGRGENYFGSSIATWREGIATWLVAGASGDDDKGAAYIFMRTSDDAPWHQQARLQPSDLIDGDGFGFAVGIASDVVVVSALNHKVGSDQGAVYTFVHDHATGAWAQESAELSFGGGGSFGFSLTLRDTLLVVGAPSLGSSGYAAVYRRTASKWTLTATPAPPDSPASASFGDAISTDGNRILIGAPDDSTVAWYQGSAYLFLHDSATDGWNFERKLSSALDGVSGDNFGSTVGITGNSALVAARAANGVGKIANFAFIGATRDWAQQPTLKLADGTSGDRFGQAIMFDGSLLAVGAPGRDHGNGAVYLYRGTASSWTASGELHAGTPDGPRLGASVALAGSDILAGSPDAGRDFGDRGDIEVFRNGTTGWKNTQPIFALSDAQEFFGTSTAISRDIAVVAAPFQTSRYENSGAANIYHRDSSGKWIWAYELPVESANRNVVATDGDTIVVGAPDQAFGTHFNQGAAYVYVRSSSDASSWTQQAVLADLGGGSGDRFGTFVSISGNTLLIGAPGQMGSIGGAYVFVRSGTTWSLQAKLIPSEAVANDYVGFAGAIDGDLVIIGAPYNAMNAGSAFVFQRTGTSWTEKKKLVASDTANNDSFGESIALSDGTAFIGSPTKSIGSNSQQGRVYRFAAGSWSEQEKIDSPSPGASQHFGSALAVDEKRLLIGQPSGPSAYLYTKQSGSWLLQSKLQDDNPNSEFGNALAMHGDTILVGAYDGGARYGGRAYIFQDDRLFADGFDP